LFKKNHRTCCVRGVCINYSRYQIKLLKAEVWYYFSVKETSKLLHLLKDKRSYTSINTVYKHQTPTAQLTATVLALSSLSSRAGTTYHASSQNMMEFDESLGEIRPGRTVVRRRITIIGRQPTPSTNKKINLLFVHGSCAASSQYDDLIAEMRRKLALAQDNDHLPAMNCFLYDQLGCAKSDHPASDWSAFSSSELHLDLQTIFRSILEVGDDYFIVAHSHGEYYTVLYCR
jgi:hypothetical protein